MEELTREQRMKKFADLMSDVLNIQRALRLTDKLDAIGFFTAPASTKYHGNYEGGLFDHSMAVTESLVEITNKMSLLWLDKRSPYIVGMFHDLCKCDQYIKNEDGTYSYKSDMVLTGHGEKSVIIAQQVFGTLTEEEILCIRWHMGAYDDKSVWNNLGAAIESYPNVLWTHTADMVASRIMGI